MLDKIPTKKAGHGLDHALTIKFDNNPRQKGDIMNSQNNIITYSESPTNAPQYVYHNGNEVGFIDYIPPMLQSDKPYLFIWDPDACIPHGILLNILTAAPQQTREEMQKIINNAFDALDRAAAAGFAQQPDLTFEPCAPTAPMQKVSLKKIVIGNIYRFPKAGVGCTFGFVSLGGEYAKEIVQKINMISTSSRTEMQAALQHHFPIWTPTE